ncbi:hypothetical protein [Streptomyces hygroscopicus]|uniref:hypothetical protein n=1 Tax=Streptomyces sp. KHY 26 TaxID=3097359 RepID=UPI002556B913|nr:hypothetical protein [Streptomyces hygroscopicus]
MNWTRSGRTAAHPFDSATALVAASVTDAFAPGGIPRDPRRGILLGLRPDP